MADSTASIDSVFQKLNTDIASLDAKKNGLEQEVATLTSLKGEAAKEMASLQAQQREEEKKLGEFKLRTVEAEQESIKAMSVEKESLEGTRATADAALQALAEKEADLANRELILQRGTDVNTERSAALTAQANDLEAREKACQADRESLNAKRDELNAMQSDVDAKKQDIEGQLASLSGVKESILSLQAQLDIKGAEFDKQTEQINNRQASSDAAIIQAKSAKVKLEQFYQLAREVALKVQVGVADGDKAAVDAALTTYFELIGYTPPQPTA